MALHFYGTNFSLLESYENIFIFSSPRCLKKDILHLKLLFVKELFVFVFVSSASLIRSGQVALNWLLLKMSGAKIKKKKEGEEEQNEGDTDEKINRKMKIIDIKEIEKYKHEDERR